MSKKKHKGPPRCPYCGETSILVNGADLYPSRPDLAHVRAYVCDPCDARVGCHDGTDRPKGRLANAELRALRIAAHAAFDPFWVGGGAVKLRRVEAYRWLAEKLGLPAKRCHIGLFTEDECRRTIEVCRARAAA